MASSSQASSKAVHTAGAGLSRLPWQTGATSSKNNRSSNAGVDALYPPGDILGLQESVDEGVG